MSEIREFSLAGYEALIGGLMNRGYEVCDFAKADAAAPHLILRHDVDMSLGAAVEIAALENRLGLAAHYFVLLRTEMYNMFSEQGLAAVERLLDLGHKVGLHFDASLYHADELEDAAEWETGCLQCLTGREVEMISFHRPARSLLGRKEPLAGRHHAYQPRFFEEMAYCSDSRGLWGHGHPFDLDAVREGRALQLLTHPIWWTTDGDESPVSRLDRFAAGRHLGLRKELVRNCEPYQDAYPELSEDD